MKTVMMLTQTLDVVTLVTGPVEWLYLKSFDVDAYNGRGEVVMTNSKDEAMLFDSREDAIAAWNTQSSIVPFRHDGKPNKPLTAYTATFEEVEQ